MKKLLIITSILFLQLSANAGTYDNSFIPYSVNNFNNTGSIQQNEGHKIKYGYNAKGNYVPISVGNERIQYGYNAKGEYVPISIGGRRIRYGYNAVGDYVPLNY